MRSYKILLLFFLLTSLFACRESQFQDEIAAERRSTELIQKKDEEQATSEPIMVGGAFLFCQAMDTAEQAEEHFIACRLQKDDAVVEVPPEYQLKFYMRFESGETQAVEHRPYSESGRNDGHWSWFLTIAKDVPFQALSLSIYHPDQVSDVPMQFESAAREQVLKRSSEKIENEIVELPPETIEEVLDLGEEAAQEVVEEVVEEVSPVAEEEATEVQTLLLGEREFFILGDGALNAAANPDCSETQLEEALNLVNAEGVFTEKSFAFDVINDQTTIDLEIPKLCGISSRTDLDQHRIFVTYPDGSMEEHLVPAKANRIVLAEKKLLAAGRVTILVQARNVAIDSDIDDFLFWRPQVVADGALLALP
ncbi:MAG: hypothetical protein ACOH5I_10410 [Oligoflexus sp.]